MSLRKTAADQASQHPERPSAEALAERALNLVAFRQGHGRDIPGTSVRSSQQAPWSVRMAEAAVADDQARLIALAYEMRSAGVPVDAIVDLAIPEAARELGRRWAEDRIGFASTSIGTARLQSLLRDLMRTGTAPLISNFDDTQSALLIVVPEGEQHTLGALIASAQLSRMHFETVLSLCESRARLRMRLRAERYAAVCLSISRVETLESADDLIQFVRKQCSYPVKVMVGGAAIEHGEDFVTGADAVTNDLPVALRQCGLRVPTSVQERGAMMA